MFSLKFISFSLTITIVAGCLYTKDTTTAIYAVITMLIAIFILLEDISNKIYELTFFFKKFVLIAQEYKEENKE